MPTWLSNQKGGHIEQSLHEEKAELGDGTLNYSVGPIDICSAPMRVVYEKLRPNGKEPMVQVRNTFRLQI